MKSHLLVLLVFVCVFASRFNNAHAQGTAFTYQGRLSDNGTPANGRYDLVFSLYDVSSGGSAIAGLVTNSPTDVSNGGFTVTLDFGNKFPGAARWLEIAVRTNGGGAFNTLSPRQTLTPAPYAVYSANAGSALTAASAASASSVAAANITGAIASAQLPPGLITNGASGVNLSGTFSGDGSGLTGLSASQDLTLPAADSIDPEELGTLIFYGDSLTYGIGTGVPYPQQFCDMLHIPPSQMVNLGVGGVRSEFIYTNEFLPHSNYWGRPSVFWMGNNDGAANSNNIIPYVSNILARITTSNYLFASLTINTNTDVVGSTDTTNFNRWLSNYVGSAHYFDIRSAVSRATNGTATDAWFASQGWFPYSLLFDHAHLNTAGYGVVASALRNSSWINLNHPVTRAAVMSGIHSAMTNEIYLSALDAKGSSGSDVAISTMYPKFNPVTTSFGFLVAAGTTYQTLWYTMPVERLGGKPHVQISMQVVTTNAVSISCLHALNVITAAGAVWSGGVASVGSAGISGITNATWLDAAPFSIDATTGHMGLALGTGAIPAPATFYITAFRIRAY